MPLSPLIRSLADITGPTKDAGDRLALDWSPDSPPDTVAAGAVAGAFCDALTTLTISEIEAIGRFVEMVLTSDDEHAKSVVATGFLEALLAKASGGAMDFRNIVWMLGPESKKYCQSWDEFTKVKTDGL